MAGYILSTTLPPTLIGADLTAVANGEEETCSVNSKKGASKGPEMAVDIDYLMEDIEKDEIAAQDDHEGLQPRRLSLASS